MILDGRDRLAIRVDANRRRLRRAETGRLIEAILPALAAGCDRFSLHAGDDVCAAVKAFVRLLPSQWDDTRAYGRPHGEVSAAALSGLIADKRLTGWIEIEGPAGEDGAEIVVGTTVDALQDLLPRLLDLGLANRFTLDDAWIVSRQHGWAILIWHEGSFNLVRQDPARRPDEGA